MTVATSVETGDTATSDADFTVKTETLTFAAGETEKTFTVATTADMTDEENETFTVTLSNVSSNAELAADPTAKGTILDDDDTPIPVTLVSNIGQPPRFPDSTSTFAAIGKQYSLWFTTGGYTSYSLDSLELKVGDHAGAQVTVNLYSGLESNPFRPGASILTFTNPTSGITANAVNTFAAPGNTTLQGSTRYFVVVSGTAEIGVSDPRFEVILTVSNDTDNEGADDWVLPDGGRFRVIGTTEWISEQDAMQIRVIGAAQGTAPPDDEDRPPSFIGPNVLTVEENTTFVGTLMTTTGSCCEILRYGPFDAPDNLFSIVSTGYESAEVNFVNPQSFEQPGPERSYWYTVDVRASLDQVRGGPAARGTDALCDRDRRGGASGQAGRADTGAKPGLVHDPAGEMGHTGSERRPGLDWLQGAVPRGHDRRVDDLRPRREQGKKPDHHRAGGGDRIPGADAGRDR